MPRKITPAKLLEAAKEIAENARGDQRGREYELHPSRTTWKECPPDLRALEANKATTLSPAPDADYSLRKAFAEFDLDPHNPWHWRTLLRLLAKLHFGETWEWDENRLTLLRIRCEGYPGTNTDKIKRLKEDYPEDYLATNRSLLKILARAQKLSG